MAGNSETSENRPAEGNSDGNPPRKLRVLLETYGWPLVQVPYDDFEAIKGDKWLWD